MKIPFNSSPFQSVETGTRSIVQTAEVVQMRKYNAKVLVPNPQVLPEKNAGTVTAFIFDERGKLRVHLHYGFPSAHMRVLQ